MIALVLLSEKVQYDRDYHYHCDYQYYACLLITMIVNRYYYCNWLDFLSSSYIYFSISPNDLIGCGVITPINVLVYLCIFEISNASIYEYSRFKKHMVFPCINFRSWIIIFIQSNKNPPHPNPKKSSQKKNAPQMNDPKNFINPLATFPPFPHLGRKLFERSFTLQWQDTDGVVNTWSQLERTGGGQFLTGMHRQSCVSWYFPWETLIGI